MNLSTNHLGSVPKKRKLRHASEKQQKYEAERKRRKDRQLQRQLELAKARLHGAKAKAIAERKVQSDDKKRERTQRKFQEWKQRRLLQEAKRLEEIENGERKAPNKLRTADLEGPAYKREVKTLRKAGSEQFAPRLSQDEFILQVYNRLYGGQTVTDPSTPVGPKPRMKIEDYRSLPRCGAKLRIEREDGRTTCNRVAGERTNHLGYGRCWMHGGRLQGTRAGKITTGELEVINPFNNTLTDEELEVWNNLVGTKLEHVDQEIKLVTIREKRMMERLQRLMRMEESGDGLEVAEDEMEEEESEEEKDSTEGGETKAGKKIKRKVKKRSVAVQIIAVEEALTRVQAQKSKLIELHDKLEDQKSNDKNEVMDMIRNIRASQERREKIQNPEPGQTPDPAPVDEVVEEPAPRRTRSLRRRG